MKSGIHIILRNNLNEIRDFYNISKKLFFFYMKFGIILRNEFKEIRDFDNILLRHIFKNESGISNK